MRYIIIVALCLGFFFIENVRSGDEVVEELFDELLCFGKWDYIVVGGGASGSVVAARLSENRKNSVLLLEAGGASQYVLGGEDYVAAQYSKTSTGGTIFRKHLTRYDVPAFAGSTNPNIAINPTEGYQLRTNTGIDTPHSKILGGNAAHNNMIWTRATRGSINAWNVTGWSYNELLPYFIKSENVNGSHLAGDSVNHGHSGPIQLTDPRGMDQAGPVFIQACINSGYPNNTDFNGVSREGCGYHVFNINSEGVRDSSAAAYLPAAMKRINFKLVLNARVTKVLFNDQKKATGVKYMLGNIEYTVQACKEIVLSLGAINTPKLLMQSGVGPAPLLTSLGIPIVSNLPVGTRMLSHGGASVRYAYPGQQYQSLYDISTSAADYAQFGTGIFASAGFFGFGFVKSDNSKVEPDVLIGTFFSPIAKQINVQISLHQPVGITNGVLNISSSDPNTVPFLYLNVWDNEANVNAVVNAIKIARRIMSQYPATTIFGNETLPGPTYDTDDKLRAYVRTQAGGTNKTHLWGGARLGNIGDNTAVLDPRARVKGVKGLRVCDLSIVPLVLAGHPMANVVMFGERISAFILEDHAN